MISISKTILKSLLHNENYVKRVLPFLKQEYFDGPESILFDVIDDLYRKYNGVPNKEAIGITLQEKHGISETDLKNSHELLDEVISDTSKPNEDWLIDATEKFCKEKALYNAIMDSIAVFDENKKPNAKRDVGSIPDILTKALAVSFDPNVGHDYMEDHDVRYEAMHDVQERLPFDLSKLNLVTNGGLPKKTLSIIVGGVNVGKSLCLCHFSASALSLGKNVLYITLELSETTAAKRIDANLLDISLDDLLVIPKATYDKKISDLKLKTTGKLIVKEYPTASAHVGHFRYLLNELKMKKNFTPDLICIDYLNICCSSRVKNNGNVNSYTYVKMIAEEIRGLAVEFDVPIISATQLNREGFGDSDPDLTHTSESFGLPATADWMAIIVSNEQLEQLGQYMVKQVKSRFSDSTKNSKFFIGVDRNKQRLFDLSSGDSTNYEADELPDQVKKTIGKSNPNGKFSNFKF